MPEPLSDEVRAQIERLTLAPGRPLIVTDADEVLFAFVRGLERYLATQGAYLDLSSFSLTGNIRRRADGEPLEATAVRDLIRDFFAEHTEELEPVAGAPEALAALAGRSQILVLSNVPLDQLAARRRALARHGMDYPLVANIGRKGAAVAELARRVAAPVFFLDDIPHNIASVAELAGEAVRLHFVADPRLARLLEPAADAHARTDDWASARAFIEERLDALGF
ncbi:MAG TPA: hypothetical protein VE631_10255 [Alphaproteobacteria bacterium]|nr:hypothetical protein [Alphaproteobacteria bacterium]